MEAYPNTFACFLIDDTVVPFVVRKNILENPNDYDDYERAHARLPFDMFSEIVMSKALLELSAFYNSSIVADVGGDEVYHTAAFDGVFEPIPQEADERPLYDRQVLFETDINTVCALPLKKQPKLLEKNYDSIEEIIEEVKSFFAAHDIEMPDNFPWLDHIGELNGVLIYD